MNEIRTISNRARLVAAFAAVAIGTATFAGAAGAASPRRAPGAPAQVLEERMNGEQAIRALGARLPEVAKANGLPTDELARRLRADRQLWVGESGALLFVDEGLADHAGEHIEPPAETTGAWADHAPAEAFALHSRPGADRVIFLDFDGHDTPGAGWTGTPATPYDTDGRPSTFSDAERRAIIDVWHHVAEDFAPFAIDVTTADPGVDAIRRSTSDDRAYGTRVVVTPVKTDCGTCGGIAYIGTYDAIGADHDRYQPAWVYIAGTNAKSIAEAASHEAGHNLGLNHDGVVGGPGYYQGHGDWAPIMGVGYYEPVTQWSRGEYAGANNTEDDFAVIAANGGIPAGDDHGDTTSTATPLDPVVDTTGEIGTRTDVDAFSFTTTGGPLSLAAAPSAVGADLDLSMRLVRSDGTPVASLNPSGLAAQLETDLEAGTYTVLLDGVGTGDPRTTGYSDYGSVGRYRLTGLLPSGQLAQNRAPTARITTSTTSGTAPLPVTFGAGTSADPDSDSLTFSWTVDGTTRTDATFTHTFSTPGPYVVTLTASDGELTSTASTTITVREPTTVVAAPAAPVLTAAPSGSSVTLDWNDSTGVARYDVYRETFHKSGSFRGRTLVGTVSGDVSAWTHSSAGTGTFRYVVEAHNAAGSAASNPVDVTVASTSTGGTGKGGAKGSAKTR